MTGSHNNGRRPYGDDGRELAVMRQREAAAKRRAAQKRASRRRTVCIVLVLLAVAMAIYGIALVRDRAGQYAVFSAETLPPLSQDKALEELSDYPAYADGGGISSRCVLLCDLTTGKVICEKNAAIPLLFTVWAISLFISVFAICS